MRASGGHGEVASRFRFLDKSKQRKPVKASEKADRRAGRAIRGRRGEGEKRKGICFVRGRGFGYVNSQRELGSSPRRAASPAECITNAFCVIRLKR